MSEQLLPCPFCGSTDHLDMKDARDFITCLDCGTEGPYQPGRAVEAWNSRADHIGEANKKVGQDCEPVLVRDLAEILGRAVPDVMSAFIVAGLAPHSPNMAVSGEDALAVAAVLKTQRQDCEPIYQWRMNDGQWLDQTRSLYYSRVDAGEEKSRLRIVYVAPPKREPLSEDDISLAAIKLLGENRQWVALVNAVPIGGELRPFCVALVRALGIGGQS